MSVSSPGMPIGIFVQSPSHIAFCSRVKVQVSVGGGESPVWSADGKSLYYVAGEAIVEARLATAPGFRVLARDTVFRRVPTSSDAAFAMANYDVSRDGSRIVVPSAQSSGFSLVVVPTWRQELRERMAASRR